MSMPGMGRLLFLRVFVARVDVLRFFLAPARRAADFLTLAVARAFRQLLSPLRLRARRHRLRPRVAGLIDTELAAPRQGQLGEQAPTLVRIGLHAGLAFIAATSASTSSHIR